MKKSVFKRWWFWAIIVVIFIIIVTGGEDEDKNPSTVIEKNNAVEQKDKDVVKEEAKADYIKAGMYKVGTDITAGEYVIISDALGTGYMQISSDSTGKLESIIANENIINRTIVTIKDGQYFEVKSGEIYPIDKAPKVEPKDNQLSSGMYKVGLDIQPGEYKVSAAREEGQYLKITNANLKLK